jgi:nicotinamide phosphoribosyltransferase
MMIHPMLLCDAYKVQHYRQYPPGTEYVYSNFTPRKSRIDDVQEMVFFGLQYFIEEYLIERFDEHFFSLSRKLVMDEYRSVIGSALGDLPSYEHIEKLHELRYLPISIKAVPEGTLVPMRVPCLTIVNTLPEFYWVTNFLETLMSACLWQPCTSATIAHEYRKLLDEWARKTGMAPEFVPWQGHDFSFRGLSSPESAVLSGMGHLLSFTGTDTIPAISALRQYYSGGADGELVGGSVPATEHSVMCVGGKESEIETFRRLLKTYPTGILSIVSDTWDLWKVCTEYLPALKNEIMARDGRLVIRPDSGTPEKIICGDKFNGDPNARAGVVKLLWDAFGGTLTSTGHRLLDSHIGVIYGDGITRERAYAICANLANQGFASQVVFGIGSWTYQQNTRDTFGTAIKATWAQVDGKAVSISKCPVTDDGTKYSASGLLHVAKNEQGSLELVQDVAPELEREGMLEPVFRDGEMLRVETLSTIRERLRVARSKA